MCSSIKLLITILIALSFHSSTLCQESLLINQINNNEIEWDVIKTGWPVEDPSDTRVDKRSQFFYIKDKDNANPQHWKFNDTYVTAIKNLAKTFKISFKYWIHTINREQNKPNVQYKHSFSHYIYDEYSDGNYGGHWMEQKFSMSSDELSSFQLTNNPTDDKNVIALKDYTLEYETKNEIRNDFAQPINEPTTGGLHLKEWSKYLNPPNYDALMDKSGEYLYFSDECAEHSCVLSTNNFPRHTEAKADLSFWYWVNRKAGDAQTRIEINSIIPIDFLADGLWHKAELKNFANPLGISVTIFTKNAQVDDHSFVAIKDLNVIVHHKDSGSEGSKSYDCIKTDCLWSLSSFAHLFWAKHMTPLTTNIYYYPRNENNALEYFSHNVDLNDIDQCFLLEYFTTIEKDLTINVGYNIKGENYRDTIVSIRPKVGQIDSAFLCVRDLIALNAKDFIVSIAVQQYDYSDGVNGFALKVTEGTRNSILGTSLDPVWNFEAELLAFLTEWSEIHYTGLPRWPDEWHSLNKEFSAHFTTNENLIKFTATATRHTPTSAHLISKWIKYDPKLHDIDPQFSIHAPNTAMFHSFTVTPKVCDWLMHCVDAVLEDRNTVSSVLRTYKFKFPTMQHSKYIKLVFYIEYYIPLSYEDQSTHTVEFDLKLVHFGDPCYSYVDRCKGLDVPDVCASDKHDLNTVPNEPHCECSHTQWYNGDCKTTNYCSKPVPPATTGVSMGGYCALKDLDCENIRNSDGSYTKAKCICNDTKINWDETKQDCAEPHVSPTNWNETVVDSGYYYPTNANNKLMINFANIDTTKYDVCLRIDYHSNNVVSLRSDYVHQNSQKQMFNISLTNELTDRSFRLCIRDFVHTIHEDFALAFTVSHPAVTDWTDAETFSLSYSAPLLQPKSQPIKYLRNWHHTNDVNWNDWVSFIPENSFEKSIPSGQRRQLKFKAPISGQTASVAMMTSEWIEFSSDLTRQKNLLAIKYKQTSRRYFNFILKIQRNQNGVLLTTTEKFPDTETPANSDGIIVAEKTAFPINMNSGEQFKLIIEISYANPDIAVVNETLEIEFVDISIGDPCYDLLSNSFVCKNSGVCHGLAPLNFSCVCTDEYSGTNCSQTNLCKTEAKERCNNFPLLPRDMQTSHSTCLSNYTGIIHKPQCVCESGDYYWDFLSERCVRKSYRKTVVHCAGPLNDSMTSCSFMSATRTDFEWSNSNLPPIYKDNYSLMPFYYPRKANSELKIEVRNLNVKTEACFKFHYYITDGSRLHIKFNNYPIIDLTPTRVYYPVINKEFTEWLPKTEQDVETICLRKYFFANNITDYYNVTFVANITNLSNNMIALKFIGNDDTKNYMGFSERPFETFSELPYLIHWSKHYQTEHDRLDDDPAVNSVNSSNFEFNNQWPLRFPSNHWTHDENGNLDTVTFRGSLTSVESVAYLMSNWLQKNIEGYKLRFRISSATNFLRFAIDTRVYDNTMKVVQSFPNHRIGDSSILANAATVDNNSITQIYHIEKVNTSFRVGFTVHYQLRQNDRHSDVEFRLESIDVGDPCVKDDTTFNSCSDHGNCTRLGPVDKHDCHCPAGWDINKENCNTTDWCSFNHNIDSDLMTGSEFCSAHDGGVCSNLMRTISGLNFQCNCRANVTEWRADDRRCENIPRCPLSNKCVPHIESCLEPQGDSVDPTCVCNEALGYYSVSSSDNQTNVCELLDPCNVRHNPEPCGKSRAQCFRNAQATKVGSTVEGYVCVCPKGYTTNNINAKQNTQCLSVMCEFHGLNNCQQKCTNNDTASAGYTCGCYNDEIYAVSATNSSECTLRPEKQCSCQNAAINYYCHTNSGDQCSCQTGYQYANNTCEPSTTNPVNPAICPDSKVKEENGVLVCDCNDAIYVRNEVDHHCDLKPICGEGSQGRANCESKNAKCVSDNNEIGNYRCECPLGKIFENGVSTTLPKDDPMNYTCIDYCAVSKREEICELINAKCDASKVFDRSNGQLLELHNLYDFCECKPGYVRVLNTVGFECSLAPSTYELKMLIKDTFKYNNVTITNERLVHITRETSKRRKKRQLVPYDSLNDANRHGFYNDYNSSYHLNSQLDSESVVNINKAEFAKLLSTSLTTILNETSLGDKLRSVTVESCLLTADRYYDCVFSVTLQSSLEHKDDIAIHMSEVCEKQANSDDCYIRHASNTDPLVFKSTSFIVDVYDPCDSKRSAVNCPEYTTCKSINYPNNSYYACVCDPEYFDVKSNRTIRNEDHSLVTYIDSCRPKDLCAMNCRAIMTDGGRCEQEQPRLENNKWIIPRPKCICGTNSKVLAENGLSCYEPCSPTLCHNHGDCHVMNVNPYYVCACRDGWSGAQCDHDSASKSRTGWIVSVVILAVLLLVAIGLALGFAYKYKQSSMRTKQSSGFMNKRISLEDLQSSQAGGGGGGQQQSTMYSQQQSYH